MSTEIQKTNKNDVVTPLLSPNLSVFLNENDELSVMDADRDVKPISNFVSGTSGTSGESGGTLEILSTYPTTDASKVGQKFIYKGNEWKYHSQAELDDFGWGTIVSAGFPAPVVKNYNPFIINTIISGNVVLFGYPAPTTVETTPNSAITMLNYTFRWRSGNIAEIVVDMIGYGRPELLKHLVLNAFGFAGIRVVGIRNAQFLTSLEDTGTIHALTMRSSVSDTVINDLFTQLPITTKTATINVAGNDGSATCDPTIATAKGYTVIT